jgi:hypothetical protein
MKLNFAEHLYNTNHTCTNIETILEILHVLQKDQKLNITEEYKINKQYKKSPVNVR